MPQEALGSIYFSSKVEAEWRKQTCSHVRGFDGIPNVTENLEILRPVICLAAFSISPLPLPILPSGPICETFPVDYYHFEGRGRLPAMVHGPRHLFLLT